MLAFADFLNAKTKCQTFQKPEINATILDRAFLQAIKYVQKQCFGPALKMQRNNSPDHYDAFLKRLRNLAVNSEKTRQINELKTLRNLQPCLGPDMSLRVEGRFENADLPTDTKHPKILQSRHAMKLRDVFHEHSDAGRAGPSYTLMKTHQRFWIIHKISSVKHFISECGKCSTVFVKRKGSDS